MRLPRANIYIEASSAVCGRPFNHRVQVGAAATAATAAAPRRASRAARGIVAYFHFIIKSQQSQINSERKSKMPH